MDKFKFEGKLRTYLLIFMAIGVASMAVTFFMDDALHTRFWTNYLNNAVFFTGIAFVSLFTVAAFTTAYAGWFVLMKRVWESFYMFLIPGLILILVVAAGIWGDFHHLYHWADPEAVAHDEILQHKSAFLNKNWFTFGTIIIVGIWIFFAWRLRSLSLAEDAADSGNYAQYKKTKFLAAFFLPIAAFSSAAMFWQWVMSLDAHWYSTMFAWYSMSSLFVASLALVILTLIYLKSKGYYERVSYDHFHDLGKFLFAFSIFWTYLWYSQYMLIWYGNIGEETIYFKERLTNYKGLYWAVLFMNFVIPFFVLMSNSAKRKYKTLIVISVLLFFGHWLDFFFMIKPGALLTAQHALGHHAEEAASHGANFVAGFTMPGILEILTMLGFLAMFLFFGFRQLTKASLEPKNDPFLEESIHHHV